MNRLHTLMSPVCFRDPPEGASATPIIRPLLKSSVLTDPGPPLFWLDEMLGGGLQIPEVNLSSPPQIHPEVPNTFQTAPSFLLLLAGPPGSGKSTFALELCHNLARTPQPPGVSSLAGRTLRTLYISSELEANRVIENCRSFGWDQDKRVFFPFRQGEGQARRRPNDRDTGYCVVCGTEALKYKYLNGVLQQREEAEFREPRAFFKLLSKIWIATSRGDLDIDADHVVNRVNPEPLPDVVVVDSLNVLDREKIATQLLDLRYEIGSGPLHPLLLVIVVDGFTGSEPTNTWEFLADAAFRFDGDIGSDGYYQRSFQIMKIKTQSHAWGQHGYKVLDSGRTRDTPYLTTGGTFIFPTVHWHLSRSIRTEDTIATSSTKSSIEFEPYPTRFDNLDRILSAGEFEAGDDSKRSCGGFPANQTTALVGRRGGMKSHLAYDFLLTHALGNPDRNVRPKNVLLISLRDDLNAAKATLRSILQQQFPQWCKLQKEIVQELMDGDRIEVLYNWPGCVSPGEFFHRIFVALKRPRRAAELSLAGGTSIAQPARTTAEIVVLNGLDHLESKFPLCANERVFVPALVSLFRCNQVCSVIIAADEGMGAASTQIQATSDLIIDFSDADDDERQIAKVPDDIWQSAKLTAVRVPAGRIGGLWGILARDHSGRMSFFPEPRVLQP